MKSQIKVLKRFLVYLIREFKLQVSQIKNSWPKEKILKDSKKEQGSKTNSMSKKTTFKCLNKTKSQNATPINKQKMVSLKTL